MTPKWTRKKPGDIAVERTNFRFYFPVVTCIVLNLLISDYLVANGVMVEHVLPTGEVQPHMLTAGTKIVDGLVTYPGQPTLFDM